ncbi:MAG: hypothetical protein MH204_00475, partial [Fimbriimonadaceae bacterium]|nr:hypothetical protein [Fimbriimonadaceae bacterium]
MTAPAAAVTRERVRDLHSLLPIPMDRWAIAWLAAISALAGGFLLMGVDGAYVGLLVVFMFVWLHSVHMAGGLKSLVGVCIGYMGLQQVVISQFAKLMMWQRPDTPLLDPTGTMQLYVVAAVAIWCGAALSRAPWLGVVRPILVTDLSTEKLRII